MRQDYEEQRQAVREQPNVTAVPLPLVHLRVRRAPRHEGAVHFAQWS